MATDTVESVYKTGTRIALTVLVSVFVFAPWLFKGPEAVFWFSDRFAMTLRLLDNFRQTGVLSLDGITPTNDISPVWGLILYGLSAVFPTTSAAFFIAVRAMLGLFLLLTLPLFNRLMTALNFTTAPQPRFFATAFLAILSLYIATSGTEAELAVSAVFLSALCLLKALRTPSVRNGLLLGLSLGLAAFIRIDTLLFSVTLALVFYFQFNFKNPITTKQLLTVLPAMIAGMMPLTAFIVWQKTTFGLMLPAGIAGWLKAQDIAPWRMLNVLLFTPICRLIQNPAGLVVLTFPVLLLILTAYNSFPWTGEEQKPRDTVFYTLLWFPILFLVVLASVTCISVPKEAFYALAVGAPVALTFALNRINTQLCEKGKANEIAQSHKVWTVLGGFLCLIGLFSCATTDSAAFRPMTEAVAEFAKTHDGRYAMGNGAGFAAFTVKKPFTALNASGQDAQMLTFLDAQVSLSDVFKHYRTDYLIVLNPTAHQGCFSAREPAQNRFGGSNKGMSDWLCASPVFEKQIGKHAKIAVFKIDSDGKATAALDKTDKKEDTFRVSLFQGD